MEHTQHPLDEAAVHLGGRAELAKRLDVTPAAIGNWKVRGVPIEHCAEIERLTHARVSRRALRPSDWPRIWPELADPAPAAHNPHPTQPAEQAQGASHV